MSIAGNPIEVANALTRLHNTLEGLGRQDDDWATARSLEDKIGAGQFSEGDIDTANRLLFKYRVFEKLNPSAEWGTFGETITGSRWFNANPTVSRTTDGRIVWDCPAKDCFGEMTKTGDVWPTGQPGYHHKCNLCGFTAAIRGAVFGETD